MNRNLGIDLLRVLSIGIVVLYHYNALGNFSLDGTHAVVIFFMISGYCMGFSTKNRTSSQFLKARLLRLVPPMFICATLSTAIESVFAEIRPDRLHGLKEYASTLICLPSGNLICDLYSNIAYGRAFTYTYVDGAYWSLLVEIRFYILFWFLTYVLRTKQTVLIIAALGILGSVNLMNNVLSESNDFMP
ncbi:MAG: acyltransferase, partial [Bdellovibrionaceae bacterium]|nr:acyltransferase [Pseudobdellovibrionaceae bacterium]